MEVKIIGEKRIKFTPQGISYILDMLANCPWKVANPLINDIMGQLKAQEGENSGPELVRSGKDSAGRGNSSTRNGGVSPVEAEPTDHRTEDIGGYSCDDVTSSCAWTKGSR